MKIVFITPAAGLRRIPMYRWAGKIYGQSNSITGPLILGGIMKKAGHEVEVYEELNAGVPYRKLLKDTDVFCISCMTSNAPRGYQLADSLVIIGLVAVELDKASGRCIARKAQAHHNSAQT